MGRRRLAGRKWAVGLALPLISGRPLVGAKVTSQAKATARDERSSALDRE
jgi:hypothetical protein